MINVINVNAAPVAVGESYSTTAGTDLAISAPGVITNDTDIEGDSLTTVWVSGPTNGTLTLGANGQLLYGPDAGFLGLDSFFYQVTDGTLPSNTVEVEITVVAS